MSLEGTTVEGLAKMEETLLKVVADLHGKAGNTTLMRTLGWTAADYWPIRNRLVDAGRLERGGGKGGSVRLIVAETAQKSPPDQVMTSDAASIPQAAKQVKEDELYEPVTKVLRQDWAEDEGYRELLAEITAKRRSSTFPASCSTSPRSRSNPAMRLM